MTMYQHLYGNEMGGKLDSLYESGKAAGFGKIEPSAEDMVNLPESVKSKTLLLHASPCLWSTNVDLESRAWLYGYAESIQAQRMAEADADREWFLNHPSA